MFTLSKITAPLLPPATLYRASLVQKLNEVVDEPSAEAYRYKLILLCAPAGYGKTHLLADFAQHTSIPCCWYFLDHVDADRTTFLNVLLLSIRQHFPHFGEALDTLLTNLASEIVSAPKSVYFFEEAMEAFITAIKKEIKERFAIFFCNYHEINQSDSMKVLINHFLRYLPDHCVFFIESRIIPNLEFAPLIIQRKILSLGKDVLRFTPAEIRDLALLQGNAPLNEKEAEQIATSFDGWIAGILLGTRLGDIQLLDSTFSSPTGPQSLITQGNRKELFVYLLTEVFSRDLAAYAFLKDVSILQYMTPSICNDLLSIADAGERLHFLEQQGFFVVRSGEGMEIVYTCHPFVRELLSDDLQQQAPERFVSLHRRAAEIFHIASDHYQAIYHAFQANQWHFAQSIIIQIQERMLAQGQVETLARWIDGLLSTTTGIHPTLLLARTKIALLFGEYSRAVSLLDIIASAIAEQVAVISPDDLPTLQAEAGLLRSKVLFQKGDYSQAQALCQQVLDTVAVDEVALRAEAYMRLGVGANLLGDFQTGITYFQKALHLWGREVKTWQTADLHSALASTYGLIGNFALAEHHLARARTCWEHLHNEWGKIDNLIRMGLIKHYRGGFTEAEAHFTEALQLSRGYLRFRREEAYALVSLGELYLDQGLYNQALSCLDEGLALAIQMEDTYLKNYTFRMLAMTHLLIGDASTAHLLISEIDQRAENAPSTRYEKALRELVYGTILLYERRFSEALSCLASIEYPLNQMGLKREQAQLTLRLAACQLAQEKSDEATRLLGKLAATTWHDELEYLIITELHRLPELERFVKTQQEMVHIRPFLQKEKDVSEEEEIPPPFSSANILLPAPLSFHADRPILYIQALGEPVIALDNVPITRWHLARAMELVFFLLEKGCPVHKEHIFDALWPETKGQIEQTLRTNVYYARKALGEKTIIYLAGTYELKLSALYEVQYDVTTFQEHYSQAKKALESEDILMAKDRLLKALELYRGDYVQSFYSDWCIPQRDELLHTYLDARHSLAQIAWNQERFDESVSHWKHILIVDNCFEKAYIGLMRCYLRQGKKGLALRQYQRCVETLKNELGIEPGTGLQNLYQNIIAASR